MAGPSKMDKSTFAGKFISKIENIDRDRIESYVRQLWQERSFLEQVFQTLVEGIIVTDTESRIVFINKRGYKLLGIRQTRKLLGQLVRPQRGESGVRVQLGPPELVRLLGSRAHGSTQKCRGLRSLLHEQVFGPGPRRRQSAPAPLQQ